MRGLIEGKTIGPEGVSRYRIHVIDQHSIRYVKRLSRNNEVIILKEKEQ